jgi:hypothetical protein
MKINIQKILPTPESNLLSINDILSAPGIYQTYSFYNNTFYLNETWYIIIMPNARIFVNTSLQQIECLDTNVWLINKFKKINATFNISISS